MRKFKFEIDWYDAVPEGATHYEIAVHDNEEDEESGIGLRGSKVFICWWKKENGLFEFWNDYHGFWQPTSAKDLSYVKPIEEIKEVTK